MIGTDQLYNETPSYDALFCIKSIFRSANIGILYPKFMLSPFTRYNSIMKKPLPPNTSNYLDKKFKLICFETPLYPSGFNTQPKKGQRRFCIVKDMKVARMIMLNNCKLFNIIINE